MKPAYTLDQVRQILRRHFGGNWEASYEAGRQEMANWLVDRLKMPLETTTRAVEELERKGMIRFEHSQLGGEVLASEFGAWTIEDSRATLEPRMQSAGRP